MYDKAISTRVDKRGKKRYTVLSKEEGHFVEVGIFRYRWLFIRNRIPINRIKNMICKPLEWLIELIWKL